MRTLPTQLYEIDEKGKPADQVIKFSGICLQKLKEHGVNITVWNVSFILGDS